MNFKIRLDNKSLKSGDSVSFKNGVYGVLCQFIGYSRVDGYGMFKRIKDIGIVHYKSLGDIWDGSKNLITINHNDERTQVSTLGYPTLIAPLESHFEEGEDEYDEILRDIKEIQRNESRNISSTDK